MPENPGTLLSTRRLLLASAAALLISALVLAVPWVRRHAVPESIVLTVAAAAALCLLALFYGWSSQQGPRIRPIFTKTARYRVHVLLGVLAVLATLTGYVALSGHLAVWIIWVAIGLLALIVAFSPEPVTVLLAGQALVVAVVAVFVGSLFRGTADTPSLIISVVAAIIPIVLSERLLNTVDARVRRRREQKKQKNAAATPTATGATAPGKSYSELRFALLLVITTVLSAAGLSWSNWLPAVAHGCYTLPTSHELTQLRSTSDGDRCYGLLDTADPGAFARSSFGHDPVTSALERAVLKNNQPVRDGDLTVVWMGALSCVPAHAGVSSCADGRDYPAERDQLRALLFAQGHIAAGHTHRLHVVIGDAGQDVTHVDDLATLIIERHQALGRRVAVVGGGDSRDTTQRAINRLLDAGIPFIAPNLLADLGAPGRPFVDRPGYLQLAPANLAYAQDTVARLAQHFPRGFRMNIYQHLDATDQYTTSLVNDMLAAVRTVTGASARHVSTLDGIDASACTSVLYFADRWTRFGDFVQRLNDVCGYARPQMVVADGSVGRFMANYQLRAVSNANWPVDYYVGGPACAELQPGAYAEMTGQIAANHDLLRAGPGFACTDRGASSAHGELHNLCTLDAAVKLTSQPCAANDLGNFLIPAYDAVLLADALLPQRPPPGRDYLTSLNLAHLTLSTGTVAAVRAGRLASPTIRVELWHVDPVNDASLNWEDPSPALAALN
jgi:hypothetical protein